MLDQLGDRIKRARELRGVSQRNLGLILGLSDKAISAYESGRTFPPLETLFRISEELEKPMVYFLADENSRESALDKIDELESLLKKLSTSLQDIRVLLLKELEMKMETPPTIPGEEKE